MDLLTKYIIRDKRRYSISSGLLLLFSTPFVVWQMGVIYFSGTSMSLFGRTPIPLSEGSTLAVIAAGYLTSAAAICLFPRKTVLMERILLPFALVATALMLFPFSSAVITVLFYIAAFVCVFSIGTLFSLASQHFTVDTTWRDGILSLVAGGVLIAILQNDIIKVSFTVFTVASILFIAALTVFCYIIPAKIEVTYAERRDGRRIPTALYTGVWLVIAFSTLLMCFATSYAESIKGGVSVLYLSAAAMAVFIYVSAKRGRTNSFRVYGALLSVAAFGFVLAYLSKDIPALSLPACALMGFTAVPASLWIFFAATAFEIYPSRYTGVVGTMMGMILAAVHSWLLELLRDNIGLLYGVYAALAVALMTAYFILEPRISRAWQQRKRLDPDSAVPFDGLSEQERILARLILDGHSETSAAREMNITLNTQKSYRKNLYAKLDIHSKRELFELAGDKENGQKHEHT